jgi:hypothetical protein
MEFGSSAKACARLKTLINDALDQGEWHDDFDIAVTRGELGHYECAELWDVVRQVYPETIKRMAANVAWVRTRWGPALDVGYRIKWLVADDESLVVTEGLCVARLTEGAPLWVTKRISWDGIYLAKIAGGEILGEWYCPTATADDWCPLRIAFTDGALLEGEEFERSQHTTGFKKMISNLFGKR